MGYSTDTDTKCLLGRVLVKISKEVTLPHCESRLPYQTKLVYPTRDLFYIPIKYLISGRYIFDAIIISPHLS